VIVGVVLLLRPAIASHTAHKAGDEVHHRDRSGYNSISNDETPRRTGELETQTAVDDADDDERTPEPDMRVADNTASLVLDVVVVVGEAERRLDDHQRYDDGAHEGVRVCKELRGR
jgi:hypothetical protein